MFISVCQVQHGETLDGAISFAQWTHPPSSGNFRQHLGMAPETSLTCLGTRVRRLPLEKCREVSQKRCVALPYWSLDMGVCSLVGCSVSGGAPSALA